MSRMNIEQARREGFRAGVRAAVQMMDFIKHLTSSEIDTLVKELTRAGTQRELHDEETK